MMSQPITRVSTRLVLVLLWLLAWASLSACERAQQTAAEPSPPHVEAQSAETLATQGAGDDVKVEVTDPGQEPRTALRYKIAKGLESRISLDMTMSMTLGGGAAMNLPKMTMLMKLNVTDANDTSTRYDFTLEDINVDASADPTMVGAMKDAMKGVKGMKGSSTFDARGGIIDSSVSLPPGAPPQIQQTVDQMQQSMKQMVIPLPEEPVGVGATWTASSVIDQTVFKLNQTATYKVTAIDGTQVTLSVKITQDAPKQKFNQPGAMELELRSLTGTGTLNVTFDLTKIAPTINGDVTVKASVGAPNDSATFDSTTSIKMGMREVK